MIRTIISDIGNVLSGFTWYDFIKARDIRKNGGASGKGDGQSDAWKEYDRGVLSEEEF